MAEFSSPLLGFPLHIGVFLLRIWKEKGFCVGFARPGKTPWVCFMAVLGTGLLLN